MMETWEHVYQSWKFHEYLTGRTDSSEVNRLLSSIRRGGTSPPFLSSRSPTHNWPKPQQLFEVRRAALEELRRLNVPSEEDPLNVSATTSSAGYRQATGKGFCNPSRAACRTRPSGSWTISEVLRNIFGMRSKPRHIGELARRQIQDLVDGKAHFLRRSHGRT